MGTNGLRALVVEDEPQLAEVLSRMLELEGWEVQAAGDGLGGVRLAEEFAPDVVVLDIGLPDIDGFEVLRRVRRADPKACVLFLTARDAVEDRVSGIRSGGDDYVTKPFSAEELMARVRGLVRRAGLAPRTDSARVQVGDLSMDEDAREVVRAGEIIELTATEFEPAPGAVQGADPEPGLEL